MGITFLMEKLQKSRLFMDYVPPGRSLGFPCPGQSPQGLTLRLLPMRIGLADGKVEFYPPDVMAEFAIPSLNLLAFFRLDSVAVPVRVCRDRVARSSAVKALYAGWDTVLGGGESDLQGLLAAALEELGLGGLYAPALEWRGWNR